MFRFLYAHRWGFLIGSTVSTILSMNKPEFWVSYRWYLSLFLFGYVGASAFVILTSDQKSQEDNEDDSNN